MKGKETQDKIEISQKEEKPKRLGFFRDFAAELNISLSHIAEKSDKKRQLMTYYMKKDDMMLDTAQEMFENIGYKLEFSFKKQVDTKYKLNIEISEQELNNQNRLAFIKKAFMKYRITSKDTAKKLKICPETIKYWFINDNVSIKYLYDIAEVWDLDLGINIRPLTTSEKEIIAKRKEEKSKIQKENELKLPE